jgi:predicted aspartyl protease
VTEASFAKSPSVFARLTGRNGIVMEYRALLDYGSDYCIVPKVDAFRLGYPEVAEDLRTAQPDIITTFASHDGYGQGISIKVERVDVGQDSFQGVEFLALDIPQVTGFDVVLGTSLLKFLKVRIDYPAKLIELEREGLNE